MSSEQFQDVLEKARLASNEVSDKATLILRRTLPDIQALQQEGTVFSPRLLGLMCSRAEGKLPDSDHQLLGSALRYVEEEQLTRMGWVLALKKADSPLDVPEASMECDKAVGILVRMSAELDGILERMGSPVGCN